jgi:Mn2+/Fe2+ NRAMP family transporter
MVSGKGLAGVVRGRYPHWVLWGAASLLIVANVINIGADLGGMAEATELVTGITHRVLIPLYGVLIVLLLFFSSYRQIARTFKWLTLVLFAYVGAGILAHPEWTVALRSTLIPHIEWSARYFSVLVGVLGTTISPYLFFWQASVEVEEDRALGRGTVRQRQGATGAELRRSFIDVVVGMFFSNFIMYFIILTTAATLHASGQTRISTAREAAEALRPLAGPAAYWLFTLGLIGTGMLGVPVLAASCAYAIAEAFAWRGSLEDKPNMARGFYAVVTIAMIVGLLLDVFGFNAVAMLFWSAVVNGVSAPPLIVLGLLLTSDRKVMGTRGQSASSAWWPRCCPCSTCAVSPRATSARPWRRCSGTMRPGTLYKVGLRSSTHADKLPVKVVTLRPPGRLVQIDR